jgi:hypothetical protein
VHYRLISEPIRAIGLVSFLLLVTLSIVGASQTNRNDGRPNSISGRVTVGGNPVREVVVLLSPNEMIYPARTTATPRTTTDADGRFKFTNVPAGRYRLSSFTPTHFTPSVDEYGQSGQFLVVSEGEDVDFADLDLQPGGVITGRIVDETGKPVVEQQVNLSVVDAGPGAPRSPSPGLNSRTDDRGIYRIYGLAAGRYFVWAGESPERPLAIGRGGSYSQMFYPGVPDRANAKPVEVEPGEEATGIDFAFTSKAKTYSVRGQVLDENDRPAPYIQIWYGPIMSEQGYIGSVGPASRSDANGRFIIEGLTVGKYGAFARGEAESEFYSDVQRFEITDSNASGIVIKLRRGVTIFGSIVVEGGEDPALATKLSSLTVNVFTIPQSDAQRMSILAPTGKQSKVGVDGSFAAFGITPGKVSISLVGYPYQKEFVLMRVERDGTPQPGGFEVQPGEIATGIRVVVTKGSCVINGQIVVEGDGIPSDARFFVALRALGENAAMRIPPSQSLADLRRRFRFEALPQGEYEVNVHLIGNRRSDGHQLPPVSATKMVTLTSGTTEVTVTINVPKRTNEGPQ